MRMPPQLRTWLAARARGLGAALSPRRGRVAAASPSSWRLARAIRLLAPCLLFSGLLSGGLLLPGPLWSSPWSQSPPALARPSADAIFAPSALVAAGAAAATAPAFAVPSRPDVPPAAPSATKLPRVVRLAVQDYDAMPHADYNKGRPQGMGVAVIREILAARGIGLSYVPYTRADDIAQAVCEGRVDLAMSVAVTTAHTRCIAYTDPYLQLAVYAVRHSDDERLINGETLKRMRIAVLDGSQIQAQAPKWFPDARLIRTASVGEAMRLVNERRADLFFAPPAMIAWQLKHGRYPHLVALPTEQLPAVMRGPSISLLYAAPHAQLPLLRLVDAELKRDPGRIERLRKRWLDEYLPEKVQTTQLTAAQREWLDRQPKLRVAIADHSAPLSSIGLDGVAEGILPDYLELLEENLGTRFEPVHAEGYRGLSTAMSAGAADIAVVPIGALPGAHWVYSQPFDHMPTMIVTRHNRPAAIGMESLAGKRVSVTQLHRVGSAVLKAAPDARVVGVTTHAEGLALVVAGKVDAHLGNLVVIDQLIKTRFDSDSFQVAPSGLEDDLAFVVDERLAPMIPIINQQLSNLSEAERQRIRSHWISAEYNYGLAWDNVIVIVIVSVSVIALISGFYLRLRQESRRRELADRKLREIAGNLPGVVFKAQRGANGHIRFPYLAGRPELLFGVGAERLAEEDQLICSRVHPDDGDGLAAAISEAARGCREINTDFRIVTEDGSTRWVRVSALPQHAQDDRGKRLAGYTGYFVDVTHAHAQAEALAAAKEQAEAATRAKSSFLATMSHEIRTPMGGMIGMLELLDRSGLDEDQRVLIGHTQDSAQSLRRILDDILDLSKIEAGHLRIEQAPMQPRVLADALAMHAAPFCRTRRLRLDVRVDESVAHTYLGDAMRLRQVLLNLMCNAIKFTEHGGVWVDIRSEQAAHDQTGRDPSRRDRAIEDEGEGPSSPPAQLRIEIGDTGIGMSADQVARVFEPFHQADDSISRRFGGTGLGLSICRSLVELMGGTIRIESREGVGTRVIALLPLRRVEAPASEPMDLRVAVTLRDPRRADALRQLLRAMGNPVVATAETGGAADLLFADGENADTVRVLRRPGSARPESYLVDADPLLFLQVQRACAWSRGAGVGGHQAVSGIEAGRDARILVAEDNPVNRELIRRQLAQLGYRCDLCEDGRAALEALRKHRYDLLLSDCQMPHIDGYALARQIRAEEGRSGGRRLPIVAITASGLPEQVDLCAAAGMDAHLIKPVHLSELRDALRQWLPGEAGAEAAGEPGARAAAVARDDREAGPDDAQQVLATIAPALRSVVPILLRELPADLARIDAAVAGGGGAAAAAAVHRAIGSIALFDAGLARAGQDLEARLLVEPVAALDSALDEFTGGVRGLQARLATADARA